MTATPAPYLLDNAAEEAPARLAALEAMFDTHTRRHLLGRGVGPGWHCLEVGAGNGSVAAWLAERVGRGGRVVATDLDPRHLAARVVPDVEVLRHDLTADPLPEAAFDLVHARLVLVHLRDWERVLVRLVAALKPGGWLVAEEFDSDSLPPDPTVSPGEVRLATYGALARLMADRGFDRRFGRRLFGRLRGVGLTDVGAEGRLEMLDRDAAGASLVRANWRQLRGAMVDGGYVSPEEIDSDLARLDASDFMMPSSILWSAWGRRPAAV
jgi:SAM-dependent methyltransferase